MYLAELAHTHCSAAQNNIKNIFNTLRNRLMMNDVIFFWHSKQVIMACYMYFPMFCAVIFKHLLIASTMYRLQTGEYNLKGNIHI
jgi:hypothetical protein